MITGAQLRMAASALRWSMKDVAREAGLGWRTVQRLAAADGIPPGRATSVAAIQAAFERAGIQFQEPDDGGPGVKITKPKAKATKRPRKRA